MANDAADLQTQILTLRSQGLTDNLVVRELAAQGYGSEQIQDALTQLDMPEMPAPAGMPAAAGYPSYGMPAAPQSREEGNIYERMEEIAESLVDEKWDELIAEVKKIVAWKEKVEERQAALLSEVEKLKEDFKVLHQGVLGRLEDYDTRMRDVGTELKAVGRVFKDVIPEFVDNVKELKQLKEGWKKV